MCFVSIIRWFSSSELWTSGISSSWELVKNVNHRASHSLHPLNRKLWRQGTAFCFTLSSRWFGCALNLITTGTSRQAFGPCRIHPCRGTPLNACLPGPCFAVLTLFTLHSPGSLFSLPSLSEPRSWLSLGGHSCRPFYFQWRAPLSMLVTLTPFPSSDAVCKLVHFPESDKEDPLPATCAVSGVTILGSLRV